MQKLRKIFHFSNSFSLLFTLLLTVGALISGCNDKDRDFYSETALKVDVYVDVSAVNLDYDELYAQFAESAAAERGDDEEGRLIRLNVDESGRALLAEQVPVGSRLKFRLLFMMEDGTEAGCYDKLANGVTVARGDGGQCVIPVDEVMPPEPVPDPTPEPSPTVSPEPSPSPSVSPTPEPTPTVTPIPEPSPSASPTPEPSPSPSASPTPEPSPSPTATPDPVDVYLKVEGDLPDTGQISVSCAGWSEERGASFVVTLDKNGVTTEPVAVKRQVGDRLQLGIYFEQKEDGVYFDYEDRNIWIDEGLLWQPVFYYENFKGEGKGVVVPEAEGGKSVVTVKFADFMIVGSSATATLITYDLSSIENDSWDNKEYQPNFILLAVHKEGNFNDGPQSKRIPLRKKGSGFAPVYLHGVTPGTAYKGYYALEYLEVDENGDVIFDSYGQAACHPIVNNKDNGSVLLPEGETQKTIELKMSDFSDR